MTHRTANVLFAVALVLVLTVLGGSAAQVGDGGGTTGKAAPKPADAAKADKTNKSDTAKKADKSKKTKAAKKAETEK